MAVRVFMPNDSEAVELFNNIDYTRYREAFIEYKHFMSSLVGLFGPSDALSSLKDFKYYLDVYARQYNESNHVADETLKTQVKRLTEYVRTSSEKYSIVTNETMKKVSDLLDEIIACGEVEVYAQPYYGNRTYSEYIYHTLIEVKRKRQKMNFKKRKEDVVQMVKEFQHLRSASDLLVPIFVRFESVILGININESLEQITSEFDEIDKKLRSILEKYKDPFLEFICDELYVQDVLFVRKGEMDRVKELCEEFLKKPHNYRAQEN